MTIKIKHFFQTLFVREFPSAKSTTLKKRIILLILLLIAIFINFLPLYCSINYLQKIIFTESIILTIIGILQLEVSGFFSETYKGIYQYSNCAYGPPSFLARGLIDNKESLNRISTKIEHILFFNRSTGVNLLILGCLFQLIGLWV